MTSAEIADRICNEVQADNGQEVWITDGHYAGGQFREKIAAELERLRAMVQHLVECGLTCSRSNQTEWLEYWRDELNKALDLIGEKDRVVLHKHDFAIERAKS